MKVLKCIFFALMIFSANTLFAQQVSEEKMKEIYNEIKTPYKYGMVLTPRNDSFKVDCPTIFRKRFF